MADVLLAEGRPVREEGGEKKKAHMKGSNSLLNDGSKAANHLVSVF